MVLRVEDRAFLLLGRGAVAGMQLYLQLKDWLP